MSEESGHAEASREDSCEKRWWQSKKFFAFLLAEIGFFILMGTMLFRQGMDKVAENASFMALAVTAGFLAVGYIGGQSLVDRYVRVASMTLGRPLPEDSSGADDEQDK